MQIANSGCQMRNLVVSAVDMEEEGRSRREDRVDTCSPDTVQEIYSSGSEESCVLIIDDEVETTEEIALKLSNHGFRCLVAHDATIALQLFDEEPCISIVISDIRMPGIDGLELSKILKSRYEGKRDLALLMVTGHAGIDEAIEALKIGVLDFMTKPLHPQQLVHAVRRAEEHVHFLALEREFKDKCLRLVKEKTQQIERKNRDLMLANERLAHANQAKTQFLRMISHELNTPLSQILGFAEVMQVDGNKQEIATTLEYIQDAGTDLHRKIQSILDLVALEAEEVEPVMSRMSINALVSRVVDDYQGALGESSPLSMRLELPDEELFVVADEGRLKQAIGFLIDNALSFSLPGDEVSVVVILKTGTYSITVRDQGSGMTLDEMRLALEPFNQVDGSFARKHPGIGMGLTLARYTAELHDGSLSIDSRPGQGTAVTLELPCKAD